MINYKPGFGLVDRGIGGGIEAPIFKDGFFIGGGGGFFFPNTPDPGLLESGVCGLGEVPYEPTLSAIPYLVFNLFADCQPDLTWSPWRSLKLFAVLAATLASFIETDVGSFRKADAVFSAACFCANVVPSEGVSGLGDE